MTKALIERVLGRYRVEDEIAAGGTARVHRAHDERLGRPVAVKLLHPHLLPDERSRRRLEAEGRAVAGLNHPGIVAVFDVSTDARAPAIVMELVDGESLAARLARTGPMAPGDVARLGAEVADALYLAHRQGVVHRDVKPGNILLERQTRRARLVDFGIAHSLASGSESLTQTGVSLGTPRYMAPEQLSGVPVGPRTDLWGLGASLHEALTGRAAFDAPTPVSIARQQEQGPPPLPGVDADLARIVASCLAYRVEDRPLHAGALAAWLRAWLDGRTGDTTLAVAPVAKPVEAAGPAMETIPATAVAHRAALAAPAGAPLRWPMRRSWLTALAAVILAGGVLMAAALAARPGGEVAGDAARPTPRPTPDWVAPLFASFREACGERLSRDALMGLSRDETEAAVAAEITSCREDAGEEADDNGKPGRGHDDERPGKGKGRGRGDDDD